MTTSNQQPHDENWAATEDLHRPFPDPTAMEEWGSKEINAHIRRGPSLIEMCRAMAGRFKARKLNGFSGGASGKN